MNNFIFENSTKMYCGKGCVREYLTCLMKHYGKNVMFVYGKEAIRDNGIYDEMMECFAKAEKNIITFSGIMEFDPVPLGVVVTETQTGSEMNGRAVITNTAQKSRMGRDYPKCNPEFALIDPAYSSQASKRQMVSDGFDTLSHIMEIYFSKPDEANVSDDIAEALMKNVIQNLRAAIVNPQDYTARSNLIWDGVMAQNRILKLGKQTDFQCQQMEHQLAAYTDCNQGEGLAVLHPATTAIFIRMAVTSSGDLPSMYGAFRTQARQRRRQPVRVWKRWRRL